MKCSLEGLTPKTQFSLGIGLACFSNFLSVGINFFVKVKPSNYYSQRNKMLLFAVL